MSRPLRIEYAGAWYHVMNRGRRAEAVFSDNDDYRMFIELLKESSETWNIRISAYCLMPNHYHLLVQTPEANISRSMRHINGGWHRQLVAGVLPVPPFCTFQASSEDRGGPDVRKRIVSQLPSCV